MAARTRTEECGAWMRHVIRSRKTPRADRPARRCRCRRKSRCGTCPASTRSAAWPSAPSSCGTHPWLRSDASRTPANAMTMSGRRRSTARITGDDCSVVPVTPGQAAESSTASPDGLDGLIARCWHSVVLAHQVNGSTQRHHDPHGRPHKRQALRNRLAIRELPAGLLQVLVEIVWTLPEDRGLRPAGRLHRGDERDVRQSIPVARAPRRRDDLLVVVRNRPAHRIAAHRLVFQVRHPRRHHGHGEADGGARVDPRRPLRARGRPRRRERQQRHDRHEMPRSVRIAAFGKQVGGVNQQPCCRRRRKSDRQRTVTPPRRGGVEERDHEDRRP